MAQLVKIGVQFSLLFSKMTSLLASGLKQESPQRKDLKRRRRRRQCGLKKKEGEALRRLWSLSCISRGEESEIVGI